MAMYWLVIPVALYFFRERIATTLAGLPARKTVVQGHLITLVLGLLYILPVEFVGLGVLKRPAYLGSLWCNIFTLLYTLKSNYGAPPLPQMSGFSMSNWRQMGQAALQQLAPWLQKAMSGVDFHWLFFVLIWMSAYPSVWAILIIGRRSLWSVGSYCSNETLPETASWRESRVWKMFAPTWAKLKAQEAQVLHYSTLAEILLGIWLVVSILMPWRQILPCILYWIFLRQRYQVPRSHEAHTKAWRQLGEKAQPLLQAVPFLQKPLDMAKGWFQPQA